MKKNNQKGYVLLLAVLISSIILAMSLGIFSISLKEVALATFARDSVKAFAAASRGLECAMFADRINEDIAYTAGQSNTYFSARAPVAKYTPFAEGDSPQIKSNLGFTVENPWDINLRPKLNCFGTNGIGYSSTSTDSTSGTASFQFDFSDGTCSVVNVDKSGIETNFTANGYSDKCSSTNPRRTQRTIAVKVNI